MEREKGGGYIHSTRIPTLNPAGPVLGQPHKKNQSGSLILVGQSSHTSQPGGRTCEQDVGMHEGFGDKPLPQSIPQGIPCTIPPSSGQNLSPFRHLPAHPQVANPLL